jgi:hypothetical protein
MQEADTKKVGGRTHARGDFLVVEDPEKTGTWHMPVKVSGKVDHRLMGAAWAALHKGYRGNIYEGPSKADALRKLKALYKSEDMELPGESAESEELAEQATTFAMLRASIQTREALEQVVTLTYQFRMLADNIVYGHENDKAAELRALADEYIELVEEALGELSESDSEPPSTEIEAVESVALGESAAGAVLSIQEGEDAEGNVDPLVLEAIVIEPGWGNRKKDKHYYAPEMLEQYAHVFNGAKMYATNHNPDEKNVLTEVSQVLACPTRFTESGAPVARIGVFDERFAESIRNRAALGKLGDLHLSIQASGTARKGFEADGVKGKYIESISGEDANVDWVTRAGAGGHALALVENEREDDMPKELEQELEEQAPEEVKIEEDAEATKEPAEEAPTTEAQPEPEADAEPQQDDEPTQLGAGRVGEMLGESGLPDVSTARLAEAEWSDEAALTSAIEVEVAYVAQLTGAGRPVGQEKQEVAEQQPPEEALAAQLDEIDKRYGVYRGA